MPLRNLTKEQYTAATYDDNLLLTACPGSGKTKTLVAKIAHKLQTYDLRKRILVAITYTNIAADTITDRLDAFSIPSDNLWVGTIHSFCLEWVIKPYRGHSARTCKGYRLLDQYECQDILDSIRAELKLKSHDKINTKLNPDGSIQSTGLSPESIRAAEMYHSHLSTYKLIDFDLILSTAAEILNSHPSIGHRLSYLFDSIFIDEYQDTNQTQYDIMREILKHGNTKVCLIGDIDQAIYTGLGAVVKNGIEICKEFSLTTIKEMTLSGCFRSKQQIIDFYSEFQDNSITIRSLQNNNFPLETLSYDRITTRDDLPNSISKIVQKHLSLGVSPSEIAILHPQWYEVTSLGRAISKILPNIPFDAPGLSPIPHCHENTWYKLIRLHNIKTSNKNYNRRARLASEILLDLQEISVSINEDLNARSLLKASNKIIINEPDIIGYIQSLTQAFCSALNISIENHKGLREQYESLVKSTEKRINKDGIDRDPSNLSKYFNESTGIKITTCHSTKGDEYEVVICAGLLEGKIPHWDEIIRKSPSYSAYMARRLLYVISSRAKSALYLFSEKGIYTTTRNEYIPTKQLSIAASKLKL